MLIIHNNTLYTSVMITMKYLTIKNPLCIIINILLTHIANKFKHLIAISEYLRKD